MKITKEQIIKIHIAKTQLKLTDSQYRDILSGFINSNGEPCKSSKELNYSQANTLLKIFKKLGSKQKKNGKIKKYEEYGNRPGKYASPAQMRLIEVLWMQEAREKNETAMNHFIKRITGKSHITFIEQEDVHKIINAIKHLNTK